MKLNQNTIETLKNFAGINTNILIKQGDELSTISTMRNIFARAKVSDSFTNQFGIYDLNEFLSAVSGFSKPELTLKDKYLTISSEGSKSKVKYFYSDPSVIVSPTKEVNMPEAEVTFSLSSSNYSLSHSSSGKTFLNSASGQNISFNISNAEKMVLDSNANLGIGKSPSQRLDVSGNTNIDGDLVIVTTNPSNNTGGKISAREVVLTDPITGSQSTLNYASSGGVSRARVFFTNM